MGSGSPPPKTAEQKAMEKQQREALDNERASSERRLKAIAQKKIGKASLLGQPIEQAEAPEGPMVTGGFKRSGGRVVKIPKVASMFSRFLGVGAGAAATGQGMGKKSGTGSLIGKGAEKAAKKVTK